MEKKFAAFLLPLVLIVAFLLRLVLINDSFWMDEAAQALESMRPLKEQLQISYDFQPPIFHLLVHVVSRFGSEEWWLRLASVIPGVITVWMTYLISNELMKKKKWSAFAALLLATSSFHIYFSQELRQYALAAMFASVSWFVILRMRKNPQLQQFVAFFVISLLGLYTMYVYGFLFLGQLFYLWFVYKEKRRLIVFGVFGMFLVYLPWIPMFLEQIRIGTRLQSQLPGWSSVVSAPQTIVLLHVVMRFIGGLQTFNQQWWEYAYFGVPCIVYTILILNYLRKHVLSEKFRVVFCWLLFPILSSWLFSFFLPVLSPKRVLFSLPATYLLAALALEHLQVTWKKWLVMFMMSFQLLGVFLYWKSPSLQREDWRGIMTELRDSLSVENTIVVFGFYEPFAPWTYYEKMLGVKFATLALASERVVDAQRLDASLQTVLLYKNVLVLDYLRDLTDPERSIEAWLGKQGYQEATIIPTRNIGFIRLFQKQILYSFGK